MEWAVFPLSNDGQMVDMTFELELYDNERQILMRPPPPGIPTGQKRENPATLRAASPERSGRSLIAARSDLNTSRYFNSAGD